MIDFLLDNGLVGIDSLTRNADKSKFVYNGQGKWNLGNNFARNITIFGVDNTSPSHSDHKKITS